MFGAQPSLAAMWIFYIFLSIAPLVITGITGSNKEKGGNDK